MQHVELGDFLAVPAAPPLVLGDRPGACLTYGQADVQILSEQSYPVNGVPLTLRAPGK